MYTELIKIIEGGVSNDSKKVISYSKHLAQKLKEEGNEKLSEKILKVLSGRTGTRVYKDQLFTAPVDNDTRLNIADIYFPNEINTDIVIGDALEASVKEFITLVKSKDDLAKHDLRINMSLLLYGPPGCGKTSIANYVAKELGLPIVVARLDSLVSSLLGNTAKNIRKLFDYAKSKPCILFLDEFDAIAKARDDQHEVGELKRVINSLLQNIDDFLENHILIAATNHEDILDKAIWRRFERIVQVNKPNDEQIKKLLAVLLSHKINKSTFDQKLIENLSKLFNGFSPSEIKKIVLGAMTKSVIEKDDEFNPDRIYLELFKYNAKSSYAIEEAVAFLAQNGFTQKKISNYLDISIRQVRNCLTTH